jgi:hypothetical protein
MAVETFCRYEIKYIISDEVYRLIKQQLVDYMEADKYSRNDNFYTICNIYYDTPANEIIRKSIEKPVYKEKLRLRSYGNVNLNDTVYLEIKKKYNGCVYKRRTEITLAQAYSYINTGQKPEAKNRLDKQIKNEIDFMLHKYTPLIPAVFLSYDRVALYAMDDKSFRVTFDSNIRTRRYEVGLDKGIYGDLLLPADKWLMEVKTKDTIPLWFTKLLSVYKIFPVSFSKYGMEYRKYMLGCDDKQVSSQYSRLYA